ncbi:hypothetical protein [Fodinibius sp. SL11]|uniref:hypothetical protein n=1 Tax=Fodinibius sp. SL11 TaxID=3425690 RepID=UPI003F882144
MIEDASINFYKIDKCGFYERGSDNPEFGTIDDALSDLSEWADDKTYALTKLFEFDDYQNLSPTYCFNLIDNDVGDYLLTTWNETPNDQGNFASINGQSRVGEPDIEIQEVPDGYIPGYATYFWFISNTNLFATIRFGNNLNGHPGLQRYLNDYLCKFSSYAIKSDEVEEEFDDKIAGYTEGPPETYREELYGTFQSSPKRQEGQIEYLRNRHNDIFKIIRKDDLNYTIENERNLFQNLFSQMGIMNLGNDFIEEEHKIKYEVNYQPSLDQLNSTIDFWRETHEGNWDDIGFKLSGESGETYWLSSSLAKVTYPLNIDRLNPEVVEGSSLLSAIEQNREELLNVLE